MNVCVLTNDNPQGLLLACRLAGYARVRVSVGGKLSKILEAGWKLFAEDDNGHLTEVPTRVMRRGQDDSTREEEESCSPNILWLCDWKDTTTGWYSLSDCHLLLQASKATDSKTVAMWLAEVCKDDAVVISLQSGLHNARELRAVFGHAPASPGGPLGSIADDMPLVATVTGRKATGSIDTVDGVQSRRESASSFYSEFSGFDGLDESIDPSERSASPIPPGLLGSGLPSPSGSSDGSPSGSGFRRKAFIPIRAGDRDREDEDDLDKEDDDDDDDDKNTADMSLSESLLGGGGDESRDDQANMRQETSTPGQASPGGTIPMSTKKKPGSTLLAGGLGFGAACVVDEASMRATCVVTHHGAIVVERLTKENSLQVLDKVLLLERSGWKVRYRPREETNNWLWGDVVWRSFEAYGASLRMEGPETSRSLYSVLCDADSTHRRVYAGLLTEALEALRWQRVELMDSVTSPFGLSFRAAKSLLLLPAPVFPFCLRIVLALRFPLQAAVKGGSPYCDSTTVHRYMAPFLNGEVVRIGFEGEVQTPLNQEVLEFLSVASRHGSNGASSSKGTSSVKPANLPPLYSMSFVTTVFSCLVLLLAIVVRFIMFVVEVTFLW